MTTAAHRMLQAFVDEGVDTIFGYPGGAIMPVYDALVDVPALRHVLVRHEQGAALAADGYARATGKVGVCMATSGPGATNLITGVADAYADSVPLVVLTGQVPSDLMGTDAFQEIDVFGMTLGMVKHSYVVRTGHDGARSRLERGELDLEAFYPAFDRDCADAGPAFSAREMMERIGETTGPRPQMLAAIGRIRARGLATAALTNNWKSDDAAWNVLGDHFDAYVESAVEGV